MFYTNLVLFFNLFVSAFVCKALFFCCLTMAALPKHTDSHALGDLSVCRCAHNFGLHPRTVLRHSAVQIVLADLRARCKPVTVESGHEIVCCIAFWRLIASASPQLVSRLLTHMFAISDGDDIHWSGEGVVLDAPMMSYLLLPLPPPCPPRILAVGINSSNIERGAE